MDKASLRQSFSREWQKHYALPVLKEMGFKRQRCKKCGRYFWSIEERDYCGDPACVGYSFIGNPSGNAAGYKQTWEKVRAYFESQGHGVIDPYPVVARWREDLYFTIASINDFQPYVVRGDLEPPANPLLVPQPCIRFSDVANVGVTGRHYTNFVMIGQHAFNKDRLVYWKNEAISHDIAYLKNLGIRPEEIVFHEDVWAGGGNFGPSMEYFVKGLELGNCVFMQYEITPAGPRELKTKVIDMGAGLSRLTWITNGSPTSYSLVFPHTTPYLLSALGVKVDDRLFLEFVKQAGLLNADEVNVNAEFARLEKEGYPIEQFRQLFAVYATADHLKTFLMAFTDGAMPSNSGGGYNIRMILRRVFGFDELYNWGLDYSAVLEKVGEDTALLFPRYKELLSTAQEVLELELQKYRRLRQRAGALIASYLKRGRTSAEDLQELYESHGIPPEAVKQTAERMGVDIKIPADFYARLQRSTQRKEEKRRFSYEGKPTKVLYYTDTREFEATVVHVENGWVVLDQTAFYPTSGGQAHDTGEIDGRPVLDVVKEGGIIFHRVDGEFRPGQRVHAKINWQRRMSITRHHTAAHLLIAAARQVLGAHVWQAGAFKEEHIAHMDLTHFRRISEEELRRMEGLINDWIRQNLEVRVELMSRTEAERRYGFRIYQGGAVPGKELRIVSIDNIDHEACGGTHHLIKRTGELGFFKIVRREGIKDGVERLYFKVGEAALEHVWQLEDKLTALSQIFSSPPEQLVASARRIFEEWKTLKKENERLKLRAIQLPEKDWFLMYAEDIDAAGRVIFERGRTGAVWNERGFRLAGADEQAARRLLEVLQSRFGARGGVKGRRGAGVLTRRPKDRLIWLV